MQDLLQEGCKRSLLFLNEYLSLTCTTASVSLVFFAHIAAIHHDFSRRLLITNTRIESWLIKRLGSGVAAVVWSAVEANVGIMYASMLAMKPLLLQFFPSLLELKRLPQHVCVCLLSQIKLTTSDTTCVASRNATAESTSQTLEIKVVTEIVLRHSNSRFPTPFPHGLMPGPNSSVL